MTGPRYVEVPADRMLGLLTEIGEAVTARGGAWSTGREGREVVVTIQPPGAGAVVKVYTTLAIAADQLRDCGEDAIRIAVVSVGPNPRGLAPSVKVLRTAPRDAGDRVQCLLDRVRDRVREQYRVAQHVPPCPRCGAPMAIRESVHGPFYGCTGYPNCREIKTVPRDHG